MSRIRKIPSMFRTPGRLLRWNRRYSARKNQPLAVTFESSVDAVRTIRKHAAEGRFAYGARALIVRDYSRVPK